MSDAALVGQMNQAELPKSLEEHADPRPRVPPFLPALTVTFSVRCSAHVMFLPSTRDSPIRVCASLFTPQGDIEMMISCCSAIRAAGTAPGFHEDWLLRTQESRWKICYVAPFIAMAFRNETAAGKAQLPKMSRRSDARRHSLPSGEAPAV